MIRSMTGYGAAESVREGVLAKVELRSVNHRFLDVAVRISRDLGELESRVREGVAAHLSRGRVTATVDVQAEEERGSLVLDEGVAREYGKVFQVLEREFGASSARDPVALVQLPELVRWEARKLDSEVVRATLDGALEEALAQLLAMREREGVALRDDLETRTRRLGELLDRIGAAATDSVERSRARLEERIAQLLPEGVTPDPERLATEVAILAEKADIAEELVRFRAHGEAFLEFLEGNGPVGRRLDFLLQEMNREANTIGSKSSSSRIAHLVVEVKEEIERLREQVQNVE